MEKFIEQFLIESSRHEQLREQITMIKKIDGIKVECYLQKLQTGYYFEIEFAGICENHQVMSSEKLDVKSKLPRDMAEKLLEYIKNVKFNKFNGSFVKSKFDTAQMIKELKEIENVELHGGECCVCYEQTLKKTSCGHILCYACWSGIKVGKDDDGCPEILCPMCRENIYFGEYDGDDYEV